MTFYILEVIFILLSAVYIYLGLTEYLFWIGDSPGGGFMPVIIGGILILLSILVILDKNNKKKFNLNIRAFIPVIVMLAILALNLLIGLLLSLTVMTFAWLKWIEKYSLKTSTTIALIMGILLFAMFRIWLKVPFPTGLLNITI